MATSLDGIPWKVGMLVQHPQKPEWGPGKIVHLSGAYVHIVFRDLPGREAKQFTRSVHLTVAPTQTDPILDNLPQVEDVGGKLLLPKSRMTFEDASRKFFAVFPGGFDDPAYFDEERNYKWQAHEAYCRELGEGRLAGLLIDDNIPELTTSALKVIGMTNLLSPFESMALQDALPDLTAARRYFDALRALLEAETVDQGVFEAYAAAVIDLPAEQGKARVASWPVATVLPFLAKPEQHLLLKPESTKEAADRLGFHLHYAPKPNWMTYSALMKMGIIYLDMLRPKGARDMIDVQSFFFVTSSDLY